MKIFDWQVTKRVSSGQASTAPQAIEECLTGCRNMLTSADLNPKGAARYAAYEKAMEGKKAGDPYTAAQVLFGSCDPPSVYKAHYAELFKIWRQFNRDDLKVGNYRAVADRVLVMARLDNEMIEEMLCHWGLRQQRTLPRDYFDNDRNLKISDIKALVRAAGQINEQELVRFAAELQQEFSDRMA